MAMMEKMMDMMMGRFSVEEREEMMLKMMPKMMEDIDMAEFMPKMMATMMPVMLPVLIDQIKEFLEKMDKEGTDIMDVTPKLANKVMPGMFEVINFDKLAEKKDLVMNKFMEQPEIKHKMPQAKMKMMPGCLSGMLPEIPAEERMEFVTYMMGILYEKGCEGLSDEQQAKLKESMKEVLKD